MAKLYTRTGDDGTTGLFGGQRVSKDDLRVEAYGTVDETNAALGLCVAALVNEPIGKPHLTSDPATTTPPKAQPARKMGVTPKLSQLTDLLQPILTTLQSRLFDLGADLATPTGSKHEDKVARISEAHVKEAEDWIDQVESGNTPMTQFVLPGGTELAARLHLARTISRRAERAMVTLSHAEPINPQAVIYVNRLSDLLFAMARRANREAGVADVAWQKS
jgi:cob(I)alamin adenosyltransferase